MTYQHLVNAIGLDFCMKIVFLHMMVKCCTTNNINMILASHFLAWMGPSWWDGTGVRPLWGLIKNRWSRLVIFDITKDSLLHTL